MSRTFRDNPPIMPSSGTEPSEFIQAIVAILDRDLRTVRREIEAYPDERDLWRDVPGLANVGGTLVLHLTGNIQHYFGTRLAGADYVRDRPAEFARRNVPRSELLREVDAARAAIQAARSALRDEDLRADFPEVITGCRVRTSEYLIHLVTHFAYHMGQLDYHRRVVTGKNVGVDAVRPADLNSARPVGD
jgi:uncharacterized damage-inducible protein DinB